MLAVLGGYLLLYFAFTHIPSLSAFNQLPDVSYGLYLYGWPIQKLLIWYFPLVTPGGLFIASISIGIGAGLLSWFLVEKPCLQFKPKIPNDTLAILPVGQK